MVFTPKKREPKETWQMNRKRILERDQSIRPRCAAKVNKSSAQLGQIISRKLRNNKFKNLRSLSCRCHHLLENDHRHRKMIIKALKNGVLCPNWSAELRK